MLDESVTCSAAHYYNYFIASLCVFPCYSDRLRGRVVKRVRGHAADLV